MRHKNKVVVITGAAQGIGLACAKRFYDEGAYLFLLDVQEDRLREAAANFGDRAEVMAIDLNHFNWMVAAEVVRAVCSRFGRIDVLMNNAGVMHVEDFVNHSEEQWDRVMRINLKAPFLLGQAVAKLMIEQGEGGAIINLSSINAELANPGTVSYVVSKGGVKQLTAVMALSLIGHGIRVNAIGPGTTATEMVAKSVVSNPQQRHMILSRTPAGRCGDPSEIASVASFLASEDASYIVGQTIYPDGGRLILNGTVDVTE